MDCREVIEDVAGRGPGETPPGPVLAHLASCPACRDRAGRLGRLDALAREALDATTLAAPRPSAPVRPVLRWAAAAGLLLAAALSVTLSRRGSRGPSAPPPVQPGEPLPSAPVRIRGQAADLGPGAIAEVSTDGEVLLTPPSGASPWRVSLSAGACWMDVASGEPLSLERPLQARILPGSQVEVRVLQAPPRAAALLLREARADDAPRAELSVVSGQAVLLTPGGETPVGAGMKARIGPDGAPGLGPLTAADLAGIESWRARRIASAATRRLSPREIVQRSAGGARLEGGLALLSAPSGAGAFVSLEGTGPRTAIHLEFRRARGHLLLRYPVAGGTGETTLGDLPECRDGAWHALDVASGGRVAEVFLDGRRLLRVLPEPSPARSAGVGISGGAVEIRALDLGEERPW